MKNEYSYFYGDTGISIQDVQEVELEMLIEFDRICRLHGLPYQLFAGTLLGAVRHKAFIPWDDDIDVAMRRCDYDKFIEYCQKDLGQEYFLQTCFSDPTSIIQFAKIRKNGTRYENEVDNLPTSNTGIWIDIFPLDNVKEESLAAKIQRFQIQLLYAITTSSVKTRVSISPKRWKRIARKGFSIMLKIVPKKDIDKSLLKVFTRYNREDTKFISHLTMGGRKKEYHGYMQKASDFISLKEFEFCGHEFLGPCNYDEVLRNIYGNYMELPPVEKRIPMHGVTVVKI